MVVRVVMACVLALLVGCGKPSPASPATAGSTPGAPGTPGASVTDEAQLATALSQLTQVARRYAAEQRRAPKTLDELVTGGYLTSVPAAPAGKKFAIDKNLQVFLANP